ncbi:MAG: helix-turn-helix domain-containing protein [Pseudomonadota bacterium]|nr:helix-turn-helix domain-containing protein [Pseudomonadota bacterium]
MARPKAKLNITEAQKTLLEHLSRSRELPHSLTQRVQIILLAAQGKDNKTISRELNLCQDTIGLWRKRWVTGSSTD